MPLVLLVPNCTLIGTLFLSFLIVQYEELQIENSNVSMSLIKDLDGNKHLLISKAYIEIVLE